MPRLICRLLIVLAYGWAGSVSALPFTYDFGFNGEENGFSGTGSFTLSQLVGEPGLDAFEYTGVCAGFACAFSLSDVSATWTVNPDGVISALSLSAAFQEFNNFPIILGNFLSMDQSSLSTSWNCVEITGPVPMNPPKDCGSANRSSLYESGGAFLTLRAAPSPTPLPPTLFLVGVGLVGLYLFRRTYFT